MNGTQDINFNIVRASISEVHIDILIAWNDFIAVLQKVHVKTTYWSHSIEIWFNIKMNLKYFLMLNFLILNLYGMRSISNFVGTIYKTIIRPFHIITILWTCEIHYTYGYMVIIIICSDRVG